MIPPYRKINVLYRLDYLIISLYFFLVTIGWFCIYAATCGNDGFTISGRAMMQLIWIVSAFCIAFALLKIENNWYEIFAYAFYLAMIFLLIITIFLATSIKGSRSWLACGSLRIQPSEFAKVATSLSIAKTLKLYRFDEISKKKIFFPYTLILLPVLLIFLQKETGSALIFLVFFLVLFREGMSSKVLFIGFSSILFFILVIRYPNKIFSNISLGELCGFIFIYISIVGFFLAKKQKKERRKGIRCLTYFALSLILVKCFIKINFYWIIASFLIAFSIYFLLLFVKNRKIIYLWISFFTLYSLAFISFTNFIFDNILEAHQKNRIKVALGLVNDPSGAGYNINQSKIAIGSGGFKGKGYLKGTQTKLKYVPEQETDFIFCTLGEEKGFIGAVIFIILFAILIIRLIWLAEKQKNIFVRVYGYCVACILFSHFAVNIGMVLGLTPVIGIPLPFCSYGGSSLWTFTILLFIFVSLDSSKIKILY